MEKKIGAGGRNPIKIDWVRVKSLCSIQCTRDEIVAHTGVSADTYGRASKREHGKQFGDLIREWRTGGKCSLRRKQWLLANTNAAMAIFLGKQMLDQRDDIRLNHTGNIIQEIVNYGNEKPKTYLQEEEERKNAQQQEIEDVVEENVLRNSFEDKI